MRLRVTFLAVLALATAPVVAAAGADMGRLFFTPERRAMFDRQRQLNIQETQALEGSSMSLDGVVRRSSGKQTIWINGRAQSDGAVPTGVEVTARKESPGTATLRVGGETPAELKVGESINRATREKNRGLGDGTLVVKPAR